MPADAQRVKVHLADPFDASAARAIRASIERLPAPVVELDFSRVREFRDLAVGVLALGLAKQLVCTGLPRHHEQLFRWFGLVAAEKASGHFWRPEEGAP